MKWERVNFEEARAHRLFGVRGWLLFYAVSLLLGLLSAWGNALPLMKMGPRLANFGTVIVGLNLGIVLAVYLLMAVKHPMFRHFNLAVLIFNWPAQALIASAFGIPAGSFAGQSIVPWVVSLLIWGSYFQRSRRVRITFEHQVRIDDRASASQGASSVPTHAATHPGLQTSPHP